MGSAASMTSSDETANSQLTGALAGEAMRLLDGDSVLGAGKADGKGAAAIVMAIPRAQLTRLCLALDTLHARTMAQEAAEAERRRRRAASKKSSEGNGDGNADRSWQSGDSPCASEPTTPDSHDPCPEDDDRVLRAPNANTMAKLEAKETGAGAAVLEPVWPPPPTVNHSARNSGVLHAHVPPGHAGGLGDTDGDTDGDDVDGNTGGEASQQHLHQEQRTLPEALARFEPLCKASAIVDLLDSGGGLLGLGFGGDDASSMSLAQLQARVATDLANKKAQVQLRYRITELSNVYMRVIQHQLVMARGSDDDEGGGTGGAVEGGSAGTLGLGAIGRSGSGNMGMYRSRSRTSSSSDLSRSRSRSSSFDMCGVAGPGSSPGAPSFDAGAGRKWRKRLGQVIAAASDYLERTYASIFDTIATKEADSLSLCSRHQLRVAAGVVDTQTTASTVLDLYLHAVAVEPRFRRFIGDLEDRFGGPVPLHPEDRVPGDAPTTARFFMGPCKAISRVLEKTLLHPVCAGNTKRMDVTHVRDMVRGRVVLPTMAKLCALRAFMVKHAPDLGVTFVREKNRFRTPALGGWRDCLLNFYFIDDPNRHVCELQLVHHSMVSASYRLPGYQVYARVRNAYELLECAGVDMKVWWQESLGVKFRFQFDGFCNCDALTGEIATTTYVTGGLATELPPHFSLGEHVPPITNLLLRDMALAGSIQPQLLLDLPLLQQLDLRSNQLTGLVPSEISRCGFLSQINLSRNELSGPVPSEIGLLTNLTTLNLGCNELTGDIPKSLCALTKLTRLAMCRNHLSGPIPSRIAALAGLESLDLSRNAPGKGDDAILLSGLTGLIPSGLATLECLRTLDLHGNLLSGPIPRELLGPDTGLFCVRRVYLHSNHLTGPAPSNLGALGQLRILCLDDNKLTGGVPSRLPLSLHALSCERNALCGVVPFAALACMPALRVLRLEGNAGLERPGLEAARRKFPAAPPRVAGSPIMF